MCNARHGGTPPRDHRSPLLLIVDAPLGQFMAAFSKMYERQAAEQLLDIIKELPAPAR